MRIREAWGLTLALGAAASGCSKPASSSKAPPEPSVAEFARAPAEKADTRYMKIRSLLALEPEARRRATELYPLVSPVCTDPAARADFVETMQWSVGFATERFYLPMQLALEVLEHVASVCARDDLEGTLDLLDRTTDFLGAEARYHVLRARTFAVAGRLEQAREAAKRAIELGNAHAVALAANVEARMAREGTTGYVPGMLDAAIETASAEPTPQWHAVDLAALLATRSRLLLERAFWTDGAAAEDSRAEASRVLERILAGPFPTQVRSRAADLLCFELSDRGAGGAAKACERAARRFGHLGAAVQVGLELVAHAERRTGLSKLDARFATLKKGDLALVAFRGDEAELLEWARPAARLLRALATKEADVLLVDRTDHPRATAVAERIVASAGLEPWRVVKARGDTQAMPCVSALLADRRTPKGCPLESELEGALLKRSAPKVALLIGRDLDAEIDDLRLYDHPVALASLRRSEMEDKGIEAWMASLSDVLIVAPAGK